MLFHAWGRVPEFLTVCLSQAALTSSVVYGITSVSGFLFPEFCLRAYGQTVSILHMHENMH